MCYVSIYDGLYMHLCILDIHIYSVVYIVRVCDGVYLCICMRLYLKHVYVYISYIFMHMWCGITYVCWCTFTRIWMCMVYIYVAGVCSQILLFLCHILFVSIWVMVQILCVGNLLPHT